MLCGWAAMVINGGCAVSSAILVTPVTIYG
jgi:hypothetical protein